MTDEPWYRRWFGEEYLELYPHRNREEALRAARLFLDTARPRPGTRLLDLGCGAGRHLDAFRDAGYRPVGLDLSLPLLARSRRRTGDARVDLVCGDMRRLPLREGSVEGVTSFFTSFGYFATREEDRRVLREIRRVLRAGGVFLLDYLNAAQVRRELVPEDVQRVGGRTVRQERRIVDDRVVKRIEIQPEEPGEEARVFHERVRLYEPEELVAELGEAGLVPEERFGDYEAGSHTDDSPRLVLVGRTAR